MLQLFSLLVLGGYLGVELSSIGTQVTQSELEGAAFLWGWLPRFGSAGSRGHAGIKPLLVLSQVQELRNLGFYFRCYCVVQPARPRLLHFWAEAGCLHPLSSLLSNSSLFVLLDLVIDDPNNPSPNFVLAEYVEEVSQPKLGHVSAAIGALGEQHLAPRLFLLPYTNGIFFLVFFKDFQYSLGKHDVLTEPHTEQSFDKLLRVKRAAAILIDGREDLFYEVSLSSHGFELLSQLPAFDPVLLGHLSEETWSPHASEIFPHCSLLDRPELVMIQLDHELL